MSKEQYPVSVTLYCNSEFYEQGLCKDMEEAFSYCNEANSSFDMFEIHHDQSQLRAIGIRDFYGIIWITQ